VTITSQSGEFQSASYIAPGFYLIILNPIPGLTISNQLIPLGTVLSGIGGFILTTLPGFGGGQGQIGIRVTDSAGLLVDQSFLLHVDLLGV
jgi:hypothetical protein